MNEPHRKRLPDVRPSITIRQEVCGFKLYITVGFYDDQPHRSDPAEVFCKLAKHGTEIAGLLDGVCIMISLSLQYSVPWEKIKDKFLATRFGNSDLSHSSLLDGLVKTISQAITERKELIGENNDSSQD